MRALVWVSIALAGVIVLVSAAVIYCALRLGGQVDDEGFREEDEP